MFRELSQIASLIKLAPKLHEHLRTMQERLGQITAQGSAGGDLVQVVVNGRLDLLRVRIADQALADREVLEELVCSAVNQALERARELVAKETTRVAQNLGLPDLPDSFPLAGGSGTES